MNRVALPQGDVGLSASIDQGACPIEVGVVHDHLLDSTTLPSIARLSSGLSTAIVQPGAIITRARGEDEHAVKGPQNSSSIVSLSVSTR